MYGKKTATAAFAAAALALGTPMAGPADAHHRTADQWERRDNHHHGTWIYRVDSRTRQHRRWHDWYANRGGETDRRHPKVPAQRVDSTAYCLSGAMANGQRAHTGAAAMNGVPLGTKFRVKTGPLRGEVFTVKDRVGHGSEFDIAMPDRCSAASRYGRRVINIRRVPS